MENKDVDIQRLASENPELWALLINLAKDTYSTVPTPVPDNSFLRSPKEEAVEEADAYLKNRPLREERSKIFLSEVKKILPQLFDSSGELIDPRATTNEEEK